MTILRKRKTMPLVLMTALFGLFSAHAVETFRNKITVVNGSTMNIIKVLASADGANYESFNVGKGIRPGKSQKFSVDGSNQPCELQIKVMYADRSETAPVRVNACEKDVTVEFD